MLSHLFCFSVAIGTIYVQAEIVDANCTRYGQYTRAAFACENKFSDVFCNDLFGSSPPIELDGSSDRNPACYQAKGDSGISDDKKDGAIASCAKTCGYCCQTPEYDCLNRGVRIRCETVGKDQCEDPAWKEILTTECPATCGFCSRNPHVGCVDKVPACGNDPKFCHYVDNQAFVRENCKRTCGFCWGEI